MGPRTDLEPTFQCCECGYDLRATHRESVCPECGVPVITSEIRHKRRQRLRLWMPPVRKVLAGLLVMLVLLVLVCTSYHVGHECHACLNCGLVEYGRIHEIWLPWTDVRLARFKGSAKEVLSYSVLPRLIDPNGACAHQWHCYSRDVQPILDRIIGAPRMGVPNVSYPSGVIEEEDFEEFSKAHPGVVAELPSKIRESFQVPTRAVKDFLEEEYCKWLKETKGAECYYPPRD